MSVDQIGASPPPAPAGGDGPRVVALGGGHGLSMTLLALRRLEVEPTAVVTVADDGGSSGRLRRDLGIIAPGDLRMALLALADDAELADVLAHRFSAGQLSGHALGNLLLVALAERHGGFVGALEQAGRLLRCRGTVLPSTTEAVELHARSDDGAHLHGQARVSAAHDRIDHVWLEPSEPAGCAASVGAIAEADVVVLGPGSLFTSLVVNLLVPDIAKAVRETSARLVHVANTRTQPGETSGIDLDGHLATLLHHLGGRALDVTIVHDGPLRSRAPGTPLVGPPTIAGVGEVLARDLVMRDESGAARDAHDPERLAAALRQVVAASGPAGASSRAVRRRP